MTTFKTFIMNRLTDHGMWPKDAETIFERVKDHEINQSITQRWNDQVDEYPKVMSETLWMGAKSIALEWIDENQPEAFYRPLFE